jgi:single-strand DNA-binding protein
MAGETPITVIGNLTADPELRFTPNGDAVANFTIASTPRTFDRQANEWKDGDTLFMRCSAWREMAENVAESLTKGTRVVATGNLKMRPYETREGEKRTSTELDVQEVGPSLRYATAKVAKSQRGNGGGQGGQGQQGGYGQQQGQWNGQQPQQGGQWQGNPQGQPGPFPGPQGGQQGGYGGQQDPWGGNQGGFQGADQWNTPQGTPAPYSPTQ